MSDLHYLIRRSTLASNYLTGTIPPELGNLTNLQTLCAPSSRQLLVQVPSSIALLSCIACRSHAPDTDLIRPTSQRLRDPWTHSELSTNLLEDSLPPELGRLSKLQYLCARTRTGSAHGAAVSCSACCETVVLTARRSQEMSWITPCSVLFRNQLGGTIPPQLGNLTSLQRL